MSDDENNEIDGVAPEGGDGGEEPSDEDLAAQWEAAMEESGDAEGGEGELVDEELPPPVQEAASDVKTAQLEPLEDESTPVEVSEDGPQLDVILDIPVKISMEVGNTQIAIRNLLQLNQGSVIELDRFAGEPLDVLVNGTLIAHGEVVMVNDKFGIRLTDVISQKERIKKLS